MSAMRRKDDWNFVGGHACQGLFVYVLQILLRQGSDATPMQVATQSSMQYGSTRIMVLKRDPLPSCHLTAAPSLR
jgi:hypothetical protein